MAASAPSPASAWTSGACPTAAGVTIVVDFTAFGAGVVTRCASGSPKTGFDVLAGAGFVVEQVGTMPGFVCRIDGRPGPPELCQATPTPDASWSYWHAARGGSWAYNPVGAGGTRPPQGGVEGWAFVTGGSATPPSIPPPPPPVLAQTSAPSKPAASPAPTPGPTARATPATAQPTASPVSVEPAATPTPERPAATPTATASPTAGSPTMAPEGGATPPIQRPPEPAQPIGTALGVGLVAVVAGGALAIQRRRGRHG